MNYQRVYMNQIYSSSLLGQLAHMWKNQLLCDAIIRTGQVITKAHRVVLVAACPMLQSMENASSGSHLEVRLAADIKQEAVNTFLQYLYEGYMMLTEENCRDVEKVARLLQVDNVSRCCADFYKCMQSKTGTNLGGSQYKYSGQDTTDFRHVRATELQKTVQDRMLKRSSEFHRPGSPGIKRARVHRGGSPDVTVIGADKADDTASMANSYMSAPDPWDRVPRPGAMLSKGASGKSQPGVIDIVEESLELVQTEPHDKDSGGSQGTSSRVAQKTSMAISVASQFNTDPDISIVNVTGNKENSTSSQPSRGSITVSPLPIFSDSQSHREMPGPSSSSHRQQESPRQQESQMYIREHPTSTPVRQSFSNQSKPFAAGSALQTSSISSPASSGTPPMGSPSTSKSNRTSRPDSSGEDRGKDHRSASVENQDMPPDLSIVKVESNVLDDTGGLDMHVDMPEAGVMQLHPGRLPQGGEDQEEPSDTEIEDWAREEMSNEGSNVSGDQNNSWYMGTFKDPRVVPPVPVKRQPPSAEPPSVVLYTNDKPIVHKLVPLPGTSNRKACVLCQIKKNKTRSGWPVYSRCKCDVCDVALCKRERWCFQLYHDMLNNAAQPSDIDPNNTVGSSDISHKYVPTDKISDSKDNSHNLDKLILRTMESSKGSKSGLGGSGQKQFIWLAKEPKQEPLVPQYSMSEEKDFPQWTVTHNVSPGSHSPVRESQGHQKSQSTHSSVSDGSQYAEDPQNSAGSQNTMQDGSEDSKKDESEVSPLRITVYGQTFVAYSKDSGQNKN